VPCIISTGTDADRESGEITENLFRKQLTVLERSDQTVRYLNLTNRREVLAQNVVRADRDGTYVCRREAEATGYHAAGASR
jgi:hypothetical protein